MVETPTRKDLILIGIKYGAISGAIATWAISSAIAASEVALSFPIGTFYSIMGISLGINNVITAGYVAFGLHILTGTILGTIMGAVMIRFKGILSTYKSTLIGMVSGLVIAIVLFIPVTLIFVEPSIQRITLLIGAHSGRAMLSSGISQFVIVATNGAIGFHLVWGALFGFMITSMLRIRAHRLSHVGVNA